MARKRPRVSRRRKATRQRVIEQQWDEIEKMAIGLQSGRLEAYEVFGTTLERVIKNRSQSDMYMAVVFEILPPEAQRKMLAHRHIGQSKTVLPIIKAMRAQTMRPRRERG